MDKFYNACLDNLEANAVFYQHMKSQDIPTVSPPDHFAYLHLEISVGPKVGPSSGPSSSKQPHFKSFYDHKITNTPINLEETYGKGFIILSKQGFDTKHEHDIHQLLEQKPTKENTIVLGYHDPPHLDGQQFKYWKLWNDGTMIFGASPDLNILIPHKQPLSSSTDKDVRIPMGPPPPSIHEQGESSKRKMTLQVEEAQVSDTFST